MKRYTKTCFALLLVVFMLVGCSDPTGGVSTPAGSTTDSVGATSDSTNDISDVTPDNHELIVPIVEECRVSSKRTGTKRQRIDAEDNGFEVTDTGSYWMYNNWLLYSDHGSDVIIKLCGRPDCPHSNRDCNAFFSGCNNVCYYDGYLYTYGGEGIYRVNLDGSDRLLVFDFLHFKAGLEEKYQGTFAPQIWNGVFSIALKQVDGSGEVVTTSFYYKLDGTMEAPEKAAVVEYLLNTDGDTFCGRIGFDDAGEEMGYIYGIWDPDTNTTTEFFRSPVDYSWGYYGSEAMYYIENGIVYEYTYATGTTNALFDTGHDTGPLGNYMLYCFPDVIVIGEWADNLEDVEGSILFFYDWNFQALDRVQIDYSGRVINFICGETHERIMLSDSTDPLPRYYIEKSDLGSGNITLHEYEWDFEWK